MAVLGALALSMANCSPQNAVLANAEPDLICQITGEASYRSGEPALFDFRLENRSTREMHVLKWHTPLEGIMNRIFEVTRDGEELEYLGLMARRGDPVAGDYVTIAAGDTVSASFDLASAYDLTAPGAYRLEFESRILDMTTDRAHVPRPLNQHEPQVIECNAPSFLIEA